MEVTSGAIYQSSPYTVFAGKAKEEDPLIHYLVVHDEYGVVEYETDILAAAIAWAKHFSGELTKILMGDNTETQVAAQNILPFSKPN